MSYRPFVDYHCGDVHQIWRDACAQETYDAQQHAAETSAMIEESQQRLYTNQAVVEPIYYETTNNAPSPNPLLGLLVFLLGGPKRFIFFLCVALYLLF